MAPLLLKMTHSRYYCLSDSCSIIWLSVVFFVVVSVLIAVAVVGCCALASSKGCTYCVCFCISVPPKTQGWAGGNPRLEFKSDLSGSACVCMPHLRQPWEFPGYRHTLNPSIELEVIWPDLNPFPPLPHYQQLSR